MRMFFLARTTGGEGANQTQPQEALEKRRDAVQLVMAASDGYEAPGTARDCTTHCTTCHTRRGGDVEEGPANGVSRRLEALHEQNADLRVGWGCTARYGERGGGRVGVYGNPTRTGFEGGGRVLANLEMTMTMGWRHPHSQLKHSPPDF
jgi:hypothetical protein